MKLDSLESLEEILLKFDFDQIYCSEQFFKELSENENFHINSEIFIDGFNGDNIAYLKINNKRIEINLIDSLDEIILKHSKLKSERRIKLLNIGHDSMN